MTRHYTHKEWNALPTDVAAALFNDPAVQIVRTAKGVTVTCWR